ncbi:hypothetical protein HNY73_000975 [Argiope bruennichi]|uniref:Uncharacterized protein n=1 Tax=Argiope bruennichi TaxID=94029 RepID=A0A8T0G3I5_ARGBR|nr:hypothetical protein HNY73_000975 [Argiope bruennichi]
MDNHFSKMFVIKFIILLLFIKEGLCMDFQLRAPRFQHEPANRIDFSNFPTGTESIYLHFNRMTNLQRKILDHSGEYVFLSSNPYNPHLIFQYLVLDTTVNHITPTA